MIELLRKLQNGDRRYPVAAGPEGSASARTRENLDGATAPSQSADTAAGLALSWRRAGTRQAPRRTFAENDHAQDLVLGDIADTGGADQPTILHYIDAVGEVEDVMDVMADEEDADAFLFQRESEIADLLGLSGAKRRRRFVHDQYARIKMDGAGDRNRLTLASRKRADRILEAAEMRVEPGHDPAGLAFHRGVVERAPAGKDLAAKENIGGSIDIVGQRQGLVDGLDAIGLGVTGRGDMGFFTVDPDLATFSRIGAGKDLDQSRFAGAIMAEQPDHFALMQLHRDVVYRLDAAKGEGNVPPLDKRGWGRLCPDGSLPHFTWLRLMVSIQTAATSTSPTTMFCSGASTPR